MTFSTFVVRPQWFSIIMTTPSFCAVGRQALMDSITQSKALLSVNPAIGGSSPLTFIRSSNDAMVFQRPELSRMEGMPSRPASSRQRFVWSMSFCALGQVGRHEVLVDGQHHQVDARAERALLEAVDVRGAFLRHLAVQDLDAVEPQPRRVVDDVLDRRALAAEVPVPNNSRRPA